ncbi:MAG: hypothetical protein MUF36_11275 [Bacteroidales bacterium]|nr:hypothetical protein [Bacteroidales bacterium]
MGFKGKISVIPSTNISSIPLLCNILMGWGMEFSVVLFENELENRIAETLKETLFKTDTLNRKLIIRMPAPVFNAEDLLSTLDFKNHILKSREGITVANSEYIKEKEIPRNFMFSRFLTDVKSEIIKLTDFDEESQENFRKVIDMLKGLK